MSADPPVRKHSTTATGGTRGVNFDSSGAQYEYFCRAETLRPSDEGRPQTDNSRRFSSHCKRLVSSVALATTPGPSAGAGPSGSAHAPRRSCNSNRTDRQDSDTPQGRSTFRRSDAFHSGYGFTRSLPLDVPPREKCYTTVSRNIIQNDYVSSFMMAITVYILCADDVRLLTTNQNADIIFGAVAVVCIALFTFEIILSCLGKQDYFLGFFFALDLATTATLMLDLPWVLDALSKSNEDQTNEATKGRAAHIGAKAARFVRVLRLIRVFKIYKMIQESQANRNHRRTTHVINLSDDADADTYSHQEHYETRVGRRLSDRMTRCVIILVLTMLVGVQLLFVEEVLLLPMSAAYGADEVWGAFLVLKGCPMPGLSQGESCESKRLAYERAMLRYLYFHNWFARPTSLIPEDVRTPANYFSSLFLVGVASKSEAVRKEQAQFSKLRASTVAEFQRNDAREPAMFQYGEMPPAAISILSSEWGTTCDIARGSLLGISLLSEEIEDFVSYTVNCPQRLRPTERTFYYSQRQTRESHDEDFHFEFWFDRRRFVQEEAAYSLGMTLFVCIALLGAAVVFHHDVNQLVLYPVEAMIKRVRDIRDDPVQAIRRFQKQEDKTAALNTGEDMEKLPSQKTQRGAQEAFSKCWSCTYSTPGETLETVILERTIIKLGSLLVLGFGEAGANIVTQNMRGARHNASVSAMIAGTRVECVMGNVRIRDFSMVTEVLQSRVMTFVNQVAEIVHGVVDEFLGAPNKNNGDTFLVIWKTTGMTQAVTSRTADFSMIAMGRIIGAVHTAPLLSEYRRHPGLQWRLPSHERVKVTAGLHWGWAIEGAVGSEFKIDASYLSSNVSVAYSVEDASAIYGSHLLLTESVLDLCSPNMRTVPRLIDKVFVSGSKDPYKLYTVDLYTIDLQDEEPLRRGHRTRAIEWTARLRFKAQQFLEAEKLFKRSEKLDSYGYWQHEPGIEEMRRKHTIEFKQLFSTGYQNFFEGEWTVARAFLEICKDMLGFTDGPSNALLEFIDFHRTTPPEGWDGVRDLEEAARLRAAFATAQESFEDQEASSHDGRRLHSQAAGMGPNRCVRRSPSRRMTRQRSAARSNTRGISARVRNAMAPQREDTDRESSATVGDGTGGTGSRRGTPVIEEAPVQDLVARLRTRLHPSTDPSTDKSSVIGRYPSSLIPLSLNSSAPTSSGTGVVLATVRTISARGEGGPKKKSRGSSAQRPSVSRTRVNRTASREPRSSPTPPPASGSGGHTGATDSADDDARSMSTKPSTAPKNVVQARRVQKKDSPHGGHPPHAGHRRPLSRPKSSSSHLHDS